MDKTLHSAATHHLPVFVTAPGETDVLMVVTAFILLGAVVAFHVPRSLADDRDFSLSGSKPAPFHSCLQAAQSYRPHSDGYGCPSAAGGSTRPA